MNEREHTHAVPSHQSTTHDDDIAQTSRHSSSLSAPENPIASGLLMRQADGNGVHDGAEGAVAAASGSSGIALPTTLMRKFESSLNADLSDVRVHTGSESATAAGAVGARAYTVGQDIHFGAGQYDPSSTAGEHLIAHEVAHTVQQRGGSPTRQNKLEVSSPHDAAEHEADRAADAMIVGAPASISSMSTSIARKDAPAVDPSTGQLLGAGDEAQAKSWQKSMQVDTLTVQTDRSRVADIIKDIEAQDKTIDSAVKADKDIEAKYAPIATNTATKISLRVLDNKLDVTGVDTAAFASQYRYAHADYQRLIAEASEYTSLTNRTRGNDPLATVGIEHDNASGLDLQATAQRERFSRARANLHTCAKKMNDQTTLVRGAANSLQAAIYKNKAAAAAAEGAEAAKKLKDLNDEIAKVATGVSTVVKIASAVGGLAGGSGATNALGTAKAGMETGGAADIAPSVWGKHAGFGNTQVLTPEEHSKQELAKAMGADVASIFGSGGGPEKMAEALVTAIGQHANKDKIGNLQNLITRKASEEATFKAAADTQQMVGYSETLQGQAGQLMTLQQAFAAAKVEMRAASEELMAHLNKGGAKGKKQARAVLFLTDAERFLAQVETALSAGANQQANLKQAAEDRRKLRGTSMASGDRGIPGENGEMKEAANQYYYRCTKIVSPGMLWGTNTQYKLDKVFVRFQDNNTVAQGGKGTIEGPGSVDDEVATKIEVLKKAKSQVQDLQKKIQTALGLGAPGLNG